MVVFQMSVHLASVLCHVSKISKTIHAYLLHPLPFEHFPQSASNFALFARMCSGAFLFGRFLAAGALRLPPRATPFAPVAIVRFLAAAEGEGGSVLGLAVPRASPGYGLLQGTAGDHCPPSHGGSCARLRDCLSSWASLWSRGFRPEPSLAGEPGPVPRKEIRRSLVILEQGSDQSKSPVELNGWLRQAPAVKRMGGLVAGRFVVTACGEAVR